MQKYVTLAYVAAGLLCWMLLTKTASSVWEIMKWTDYRILGEKLTMTTFIGLSFAALLFLFLYRSQRVNGQAAEIATELRKVTWPTRKETFAATTVVIITTFIIAIILGLFDLVWAKFTDVLY